MYTTAAMELNLMMRLFFAVGLLCMTTGVGSASSTVPPTGMSVDGTSGSRDEIHLGFEKMQRVALIIGNAAYPDWPLATPLNDARAMTELLHSLGFTVILRENATRREMHDALREFGRRLGSGGTGFFYYAGHGLQLDGSTLLLPVDAPPVSVDSVRRSAITLDTILEQMSLPRSNKLNLVILDTCQNEPFVHASSITGGGHDDPVVPENTLLAYATSPGTLASDGYGIHSSYTSELIQGLLAEPGASIEQIFKRVSFAVSQGSGYQQVPRMYSTIPQAVYLSASMTHIASRRLLTLAQGADAEADNLSLSRGILPQSGEARYELEFWESIKDSTDASDYEAYLETYPNGRFAPLARVRAQRYRTSATGEPEQAALKIEEMDAQYLVTSSVNIRELPSTKSRQLGVMQAGQTAHVTGRLLDRSWYRIVTSEGTVAYVSADRLRKPVPAPPATPVTPAAPKPVIISPAEKPASTPPIAQGHAETRDCPTCPVMISLPAGSYTMGSSPGDPSERPPHKVSITRSFAIGMYEVTAEQWSECVKAGACSYKPNISGVLDKTAARDLSWSDAQQYVKWLSKITGKAYRLPTEAEWEYAARAGTDRRFWWGDTAGAGKADCKGCGGKWSDEAPADIDAFPANPFGLYGMNGGVWEWVTDCWHKSYNGAPADGSAWDNGDCRERVIRGGSWRNDTSYAHSASRFKYDADVRYLLNGFRVAKTLP